MRSLADEVPFDIPDSWEWVRLGSISSYAEAKQKVNATSADPSISGLDLEDIEKGGRLLEHKIVGERKAVGDKTVFAKGDILYSKLRPYLLKILVSPDDGICTPEIVPFRVYGGIDPNYIVNYLKSPYVDNLINSITYGVKMPRVGTETMTSLLVPLPPLEEQRCIVEKIDEVASAVSAYDVAYRDADLNWMDKNARSTIEMNNPASRPEIAVKRDNMKDYDTIFVGFPIWWYVAPTIINTFLEGYDLTGKTIIPFATSDGSDIGKTYERLAPSCKGAKLMDGKVFKGNVGHQELAAWVEVLGL